MMLCIHLNVCSCCDRIVKYCSFLSLFVQSEWNQHTVLTVIHTISFNYSFHFFLQFIPYSLHIIISIFLSSFIHASTYTDLILYKNEYLILTRIKNPISFPSIDLTSHLIIQFILSTE